MIKKPVFLFLGFLFALPFGGCLIYGASASGDSNKTELKISGDASVNMGVGGVGSPSVCSGLAGVVFEGRILTPRGWLFGVILDLEGEKNFVDMDKMYVYICYDHFGTIWIGNCKGPERTSLCGGQELLGGTCGLDGSVLSRSSLATGVVLPIHIIGEAAKASKIVYKTPSFWGWDIEIGYTPDTKHHGIASVNNSTGDSSNGNSSGLFSKGPNDKERPSGQHNLVLCLHHSFQITTDMKTNFSFIYLFEKTRPITTQCIVSADGRKEDRTLKLNNASAFQVTASVTYKKLSLGFGYLNNGNSRQPAAACYEGNEFFLPGGFISTRDSNAGSGWNIGMKYAVTPCFAFASVVHLFSRRITKSEETKLIAVSFSAEYKLCPGVLGFVEGDWIKTESSATAGKLYNASQGKDVAVKDRNGFFFLIGMKVYF
jgi:predicted porin